MSGHGSSCGACKFLRRKCTSACVFAPFFSYEQSAAQFAAVHKIFGASNASKLLSHLPMQSRGEAAITICYEAQARIRDPIYGCVAHIFALQQQVASLQAEIEKLAAQVSPPVVNGASSRYGRKLGNMGTGFHGQLPFQQDAMVLHQALDQKVPESTCSINFDSDNNIFHGGSDHELLPIDQETLNTWDPSCSTSLSSDFTNKQSYQLEKIGVDIVPQETMWPANSAPCDFLNSNLDHYW